jgi:hypothetical protein
MKRQNTRDKENQTDRVECHYTSMTHRSRYNWVSERIINKRKILKRSEEGEKGRCLP